MADIPNLGDLLCCCSDLCGSSLKVCDNCSCFDCCSDAVGAGCSCFESVGNFLCTTDKCSACSCDTLNGCFSCDCCEACGDKIGASCATCCESSLDCVGHYCAKAGKTCECMCKCCCGDCAGCEELDKGARCACGDACRCCTCMLYNTSGTNPVYLYYGDCRCCGRYHCDFPCCAYIDPMKERWRAPCCSICEDSHNCELCTLLEAIALPWCFMSILSNNITVAQARRRYGDANHGMGTNCGVEPCMLCTSMLFTPLFGTGILFSSVYLRYKMIDTYKFSRRRCLGDELFSFFLPWLSWVQLSRELRLRDDHLGSLTVSRRWAGLDGRPAHPRPQRMGSDDVGGDDNEVLSPHEVAQMRPSYATDAPLINGHSPRGQQHRGRPPASPPRRQHQPPRPGSIRDDGAAGVPPHYITTGVVVGEVADETGDTLQRLAPPPRRPPQRPPSSSRNRHHGGGLSRDETETL